MQLGFFTDEEVKKVEVKKVIKPRIKKEPIFNCTKCGLAQSCKSSKMTIHGKGKLPILFINEYPGESDDRNNKPFTGEAGKILKEIIEELGYNLYSDFYITNAVRCFPGLDNKGKIKPPKPIQIASCRKFLLEDIKTINPQIIIPLGKIAIEGLIGNRLSGRISNTTITDWAGLNIPDQELRKYICPSWHPSMILRGNNNIDIVLYKQLKAHIQKAIELVNRPMYISNYGSEIMSITNVKEAISIINRIKENKANEAVAMDYEATGIKPYRKGHEIVCASVSDGLFSYAFPFFNNEEFRLAWKELMQSNVKKIIHNSKYENIWTKIRSGFNNKGSSWIKNIIADTMLDAHIIHNQKKVGLKFWVYAKFGILGYDSEIDPYLECDKEEKDKYGANGFNRIKEFIRLFGIEKALFYNGLDSFFTYKLWEIQQTELNNLTRQGSEFFLESSFELGKAEYNGMLLDKEGAESEFRKLTSKMNKIETKVQESKEMKKWDKEKPFRCSAPGDLTHLLFNCMKVKYDKSNVTGTGRPKADIEALETYDNPIVKDVLLWRKYKKVRDTYLNGFIREETNSIIHTSLNLHTVNTMRSSSNDPNLQNIPARDLEVMQLLRKLIIARPGHKLGEYDYKAAEAVLIACYNKDPNWIRYVSDPANDMHRDMAAKLIMRKKVDVMKDERQIAKNGFVFPTVYTSYWKNTAKNMWDQFSPETFDHLKSKGIKRLDDYREHVKSVERWFWEDQFPVGYEWMNKTLRDYEKKGYVDLYTGFRCYGPMTRAQVINTRIQGTASNCKLWTLKELGKVISKKKMDSKILLEIHDSILPDINPAEEDYLDYQVWLIGTQKLKEYFDWMIVPMFIEKKISAIDGNWSEMENKGLLKGEYFNESD